MTWHWIVAVAALAVGLAAGWVAGVRVSARRRRRERTAAWGRGRRAAAGVAEDLPEPVDLAEWLRERHDQPRSS